MKNWGLMNIMLWAIAGLIVGTLAVGENCQATLFMAELFLGSGLLIAQKIGGSLILSSTPSIFGNVYAGTGASSRLNRQGFIKKNLQIYVFVIK